MKVADFQLLVGLINASNAPVALLGDFAGILCYCPNRTHMLLGITIKSVRGKKNGREKKKKEEEAKGQRMSLSVRGSSRRDIYLQ